MATTDSMVDVGGNPDSWLPAIESLKKMLPAIIEHWKVCTSQTCACTSAAPELESALKEVRRKDRALARAFVASEDDETVSEAAGSEADDEKSSEAEEEKGKKKKKQAKKSSRAGSKRKRNDDDDDGKENEDDDEKTAPEEEDGRQKKARKTANTSSAPESQNESESDGKVDAPAPPSSPPAAAAAAAAAAAPKSPTKPRKKPLATAKDVTEYPFLLSVNDVMKSFEVSNDTQTSALLKQVIGIASSAQQQPTDPKDVLKNVSQLAPVVEHDPQRKLTTSGTLAHQCAAYEELVKTDQERGARVHERLLKDTVSRKAAMDTTLTADAQAFVQSVRDQNSKTKWHNLQKTGRLFLAHPALMRCDATVYPWTFFCREADNILKLMDALKASDSAKYTSLFEQPNAA